MNVGPWLMAKPFDSARESLFALLKFVAATKGIDRWNIPADWRPVTLHRPLIEKRKRRWAENVQEKLDELEGLFAQPELD